MSYLLTTLRRTSGSPGQPPGSALAETGGSQAFLGGLIGGFGSESFLSATEAWARTSDAALYRLAPGWTADDQFFLDGLDGQALFGDDATGAPLDAAAIGGAGLALQDVSATPTTLAVSNATQVDARLDLAADTGLLAGGLATVEGARVAEVNVRLGDALSTGPNGPALELGVIDDAVRTVTLTEVEDATVDARGLASTGGATIGITILAEDDNPHSVAVLGSVFDDRVTIGSGLGTDGNEDGADHVVSAHLGIGDDTFDSRGNGVLGTTDTVIGGQGSDVIYSGAGNDRLFGDYDRSLPAGDAGAGDMISEIANARAAFGEETGTVFFNVRAQLEFVGSESGFRNLVGYYYTDDATGQRVGGLVWDEDAANAEARENRKAVAAIDIADLSQTEAQSLGFFLLPNAAAINQQTSTNGLMGLTENESAARSAENGGRDGLIRLWEEGNAKVVVTVGAKGQGQVWLDRDGSGTLTNGDILLRGQTTNTLTSETGILQGAQYFAVNGAVPANVQHVYSGMFSDTSLNPLGQDYVKTVGNVGDAFIDRGAGQFNPITPDEDTEYGQVAFEETFGGSSGLAADRDYDDSQLQVRVFYEVARNYGDDKLYGGGGDDEIYGDDNEDPCTSTEGGNDELYGDDPQQCYGIVDGVGVSVAGWVTGTGLTVYGRTGDQLFVVREGDLADAGHFNVDAARAGINAVVWNGIGLGVDADTLPGRSGVDFHGVPGNPEINPTGDGNDMIGFRLPQAADATHIRLGVFYAPDGTSADLIESAIIVLGNDLNGDRMLTGSEITGRVWVLADGTVLETEGVVAQAAAVAPDGSRLPVGTGNPYSVANAGLFDICIQNGAPILGEGGPQLTTFTDINLASGGLFRRVEGELVAVEGPVDDPSDFVVREVCATPAQGNDTLFGGGGNDLIVGGGDRGFFQFDLNVKFVTSIATQRNGLGWYDTTTNQGELLDARVNTAEAPFHTTGTNITVDSTQLDSLAFFLIRDVTGDTRIDKYGAGAALSVSPGPGPGGTVTIGTDTFNGTFDGIQNPILVEGARANPRIEFGSVIETLQGTARVGFEDRAVPDQDYNDAVIDLRLTISPDNLQAGDTICGGQGQDVIVWNGASANCVPQGGRADGFDLVTGFDVTQDLLRFDEFEAGSALVLDVSYLGEASVLVFDQNYAAGTGVLLVGVTSAALAGAPAGFGLELF